MEQETRGAASPGFSLHSSPRLVAAVVAELRRGKSAHWQDVKHVAPSPTGGEFGKVVLAADQSAGSLNLYRLGFFPLVFSCSQLG
jgi:hypothetical protein